MMASTLAEQPPNAARRFREDGFAVLEGFLDAWLLPQLRRKVDAAASAPPAQGCARPHNRLVPLRWNDPIVELILTRARGMQALAARIGATDLRWISGYVSVKDAHSQRLWWHQDWWCWQHPVSWCSRAPQVALLCYLSDTSEARGALRVLPGSHRRSLPLHALLPAAHAVGAQLPCDHPAMSDQVGQKTLCVRTGDAVVLDYRLLHGTHANMAAERRDCVLLSFTPSWRDLPTDIRAHLIRHLAQPTDAERRDVGARWAELLPSYDGVPADLELNRVAPAYFTDGEPGS
jgi:hypothetical protein